MDEFLTTMATMVLTFLKAKHPLPDKLKQVLRDIKTTLDTTDLS